MPAHLVALPSAVWLRPQPLSMAACACFTPVSVALLRPQPLGCTARSRAAALRACSHRDSVALLRPQPLWCTAHGSERHRGRRVVGAAYDAGVRHAPCPHAHLVHGVRPQQPTRAVGGKVAVLWAAEHHRPARVGTQRRAKVNAEGAHQRRTHLVRSGACVGVWRCERLHLGHRRRRNRVRNGSRKHGSRMAVASVSLGCMAVASMSLGPGKRDQEWQWEAGMNVGPRKRHPESGVTVERPLGNEEIIPLTPSYHTLSVVVVRALVFRCRREARERVEQQRVPSRQALIHASCRCVCGRVCGCVC